MGEETGQTAHGERWKNTLVNFGSILVSYQGLSLQNGQKTLPWNEFKGIKVYDGRVSIKKQGARLDWTPLLLSQVPNLCVFQVLVHQITGVPIAQK